jgi:hypothetical protein
MNVPLRLRRLLVPVWTTFALIATGCAEFDDAHQPAVPAGRIEGRVTTGAAPVAARIELVRVTGDYRERLVLLPVVDAAGNYGIDVPVGDYLAYLRMDGINERIAHALPEPNYGYTHRDTVTVTEANSPVRIDFALGILALELLLPDVLDGRDGDVELYRVEQDGDVTSLRYIVHHITSIVAGRIYPRQIPLLPGEYVARFAAGASEAAIQAYACESVWLPGARDAAAAARYRVTANEIAMAACAATIEPLRVAGRVAGAWLELGVSNHPQLYAADLDSVLLIDHLRTDDDGEFVFDLLLPASFRLRVEHGQSIAHWIGGNGFADADVFTLESGQSLENVELLQCGLIVGIDAPLQNTDAAYCRLYDATGLTQLASTYCYLANSREFAYYNLWPGTYLLRIEAGYGGSAWLPQWFDGVDAPTEARPIVIGNPGDIVAVDVVLEPGGVIVGRLELPPTPAPHYVVFAYDADQGDEWQYHTLDALDPVFTFEGLPDGRYKLGAIVSVLYYQSTARPPVGTVWYPSTPDWTAAGIVEIVDAAVVTDVVIVVP